MDNSQVVDRRSLPVQALDTESRAAFLTNTYMHLFGAMLAFTTIEFLLFSTGLAPVVAQAMLSLPWLAILGAFMVVGWLASRTAHRAQSMVAQYLALGGFVVAEAFLFVPLLYVAQNVSGGGVIQSAALVTLMGFCGLTAIAFWTRKDFSFLGAVLRWAGIAALLLIVAGVLFGFELGTFFSVGMVAFAGAAVLYDTSNILHHYPEDRYVGASLELFASIALMFWYVLRLFMSRD